MPPVYPVIGAYVEGGVKADPHLSCTIREVGVAVPEGSHANGHVRTDRIFPIHRKSTVHGLLAAFVIQRFIELIFHIFHAHKLIKIGDCLAYAHQDLFNIKIRMQGEF